MRWVLLSALAAACLVVPSGAQDREPGALGYYRFPAIHGKRLVFAAEGDCQMIALKCVDANCSLAPPNIGDLDNVADCPAGHTPVFKEVGTDSALIPDVNSQVCQKICESDSECRWNARDSYDNQGWLDIVNLTVE